MEREKRRDKHGNANGRALAELPFYHETGSDGAEWVASVFVPMTHVNEYEYILHSIGRFTVRDAAWYIIVAVVIMPSCNHANLGSKQHFLHACTRTLWRDAIQ